MRCTAAPTNPGARCCPRPRGRCSCLASQRPAALLFREQGGGRARARAACAGSAGARDAGGVRRRLPPRRSSRPCGWRWGSGGAAPAPCRLRSPSGAQPAARQGAAVSASQRIWRALRGPAPDLQASSGRPSPSDCQLRPAPATWAVLPQATDARAATRRTPGHPAHHSRRPAARRAKSAATAECTHQSGSPARPPSQLQKHGWMMSAER